MIEIKPHSVVTPESMTVSIERDGKVVGRVDVSFGSLNQAEEELAYQAAKSAKVAWRSYVVKQLKERGIDITTREGGFALRATWSGRTVNIPTQEEIDARKANERRWYNRLRQGLFLFMYKRGLA